MGLLGEGRGLGGGASTEPRVPGACSERAGRAHSVRPESCDGSQQSRACGCLFGGMSGGGAVVDGVDEAAEAAVVAAVRGEDEAWEVGEGFLVGFLGESGALGDGAGLDEV